MLMVPALLCRNELGFLELAYFHQQVYNECVYWRKYAKNTR